MEKKFNQYQLERDTKLADDIIARLEKARDAIKYAQEISLEYCEGKCEGCPLDPACFLGALNFDNEILYKHETWLTMISRKEASNE